MARPSQTPPARAPREPKAPHPADERRAWVLANPAGFTASIRFNTRNNTVPAKTLLQAAQLATGLEVAVIGMGGSTQAAVYALPRDGGGPELVSRDEWQALVPADVRLTIRANVHANIAKG